MITELAAEVEAYLRTQRRWVPASELCNIFGVKERALRAVGGKPGLCSGFAISGDKGFKHAAIATDTEFDRACSRRRTHGISELVGVRTLRRYRQRLLSSQAPPATKDGQFLLIE